MRWLATGQVASYQETQMNADKLLHPQRATGDLCLHRLAVAFFTPTESFARFEEPENPHPLARRKLMKKLINLSFCILAVLVICPRASADITYDVLPVILSDGYAIDGGFITAAGTGALIASDITDYQIEVSGPVPYVFSRSNPMASITVEGTMQATTTDLLLPIDTDPSGTKNELSFHAEENTSMACTACKQGLFYFNTYVPNLIDDSRISYHFRDEDLEPDDGGWAIITPPIVLTIARIPEPSSFGLIVWTVLIGASAGRRCQHKA